jgi:Peptidase inhibitor I78 family
MAVEPEQNACGAAGMQDLVGRDDAVIAAMTFPEGTRLIYPGTPVTEDYHPNRLNIDIDQSGRITGVWCG